MWGTTGITEQNGAATFRERKCLLSMLPSMLFWRVGSSLSLQCKQMCNGTKVVKQTARFKRSSWTFSYYISGF